MRLKLVMGNMPTGMWLQITGDTVTLEGDRAIEDCPGVPEWVTSVEDVLELMLGETKSGVGAYWLKEDAPRGRRNGARYVTTNNVSH